MTIGLSFLKCTKSGMALVLVCWQKWYGLSIGNYMYNGPAMPEGQYLGHATITLFDNWFLGLSLTPTFTKAIMTFSMPLLILLGQYGHKGE